MRHRRRIPFSSGYTLLIPALAMTLLALPGAAQNWPAWRGPDANGVSGETGLPIAWSAGENVAWKAPMKGWGNSTPIVWGDRIFLTTQVGDGPAQGMPKRTQLGNMSPDFVNQDDPSVRFFVQCFSASDGELLWEKEVDNTLLPPVRDDEHNLASPSCVTDGERVFAWFGTGMLTCFDFEGNVLWSRHLGREFGPFVILWGHGSSPALHGDNLILTCEHDYTSYIMAVDKRTGETVWKTEHEPKGRSYATPFFVPGPRGEEMIVNASSRVDAYDPRNGRFLWTVDGLLPVMVSTPVFHEGLILTTGGYPNSPIMAIRPGGEGDVTGSHVTWKKNNGGPYVPSAIAVGGMLFIVDERGFGKAFDAKTGEQLWKARVGAATSSSPVSAEGNIYVIDETGETIVFKAAREYIEVARNPLGERAMASPAIAGGRIYLRTVDYLYAIGDGR